MKEDDFDSLPGPSVPPGIEPEAGSSLPAEPYLRISNERYAKDSVLDDRLSSDDLQMLSDMGVLL
jgi:hypothetical protein